jgi:lipoprotein-anchoring transpeptidase ErfK/SrfK
MRAAARRRSHGAWSALLVLALGLVVSCSGDSGDRGSNGGPPGGAASGDAEASPATVAIVPAAGARNVAPRTPVVVTATGGTLSEVRVSTARGSAVEGRLDAAKAKWTSTGPLAFGAAYEVTATATNAEGKATTATSTFRTVRPRAEAFPSVSPLRGMVVGVGLPIRVYFDAPIADRKAAVDAMTVTTSVPTEGAWRWFSDSEVHWRPREYWEPGTKVALDTKLYGVDLGGGVYGGAESDRHIEFSIGDSHVSVADARTHRMKVYTNGRLVKTFPVSMGRAGFPTTNGPHVVIDKNRIKVMDSTTYGLALDAGGYRTKVEYATRISNSGEFVHSAPWSVADQGRRNVSHGCINLSPARAAWFFTYSQIGDVVEVVGTSKKLGPKTGDIWDWGISWDDWVNGG